MSKNHFPYVAGVAFTYFSLCESLEWVRATPQQPGDNLIFVHSGWEAFALLCIGLFCFWVALPASWLTRKR
jgi:hypothetical protein